jgi:hypothetical protein
MALEGYTSFVIEGDKGKEIYDQIMNLKSQCELQKEEGIAVATFGEMSYYIVIYEINGEEKLCLYVQIAVYGGRASSWIEDIQYEDSILRINTCWRRDSALLLYFEDCQLNDYPGYYYHDTSEHDIYGTTNDQTGKYFVVRDDEYASSYLTLDDNTDGDVEV